MKLKVRKPTKEEIKEFVAMAIGLIIGTILLKEILA